jgi:hypothetical protein
VGFVIELKVKFICDPVDLLEVDGKFDKVIEDAEVSLDCEKLLNPFELMTPFRKFEGSENTIVSENEKGLAILSATLPTKDDWTKVFVVDSKVAV